MIDTKTNIELMKISSKIIDVLDARDEMDNSDFQGCIEAQVMIAYLLGKNTLKAKIQAELNDDAIDKGRIDCDELARNIIDLLEETK